MSSALLLSGCLLEIPLLLAGEGLGQLGVIPDKPLSGGYDPCNGMAMDAQGCARKRGAEAKGETFDGAAWKRERQAMFTVFNDCMAEAAKGAKKAKQRRIGEADQEECHRQSGLWMNKPFWEKGPMQVPPPNAVRAEGMPQS